MQNAAAGAVAGGGGEGGRGGRQEEEEEVMISPVYAGLDGPEKHKRTVFFRGNPQSKDSVVVLVDQPSLPKEFKHHSCGSVQDVFRAIRTMVVRGAPAIGVTGAYGMVLAARDSGASTHAGLIKALQAAKNELDEARPTAVNLMWATQRMIDFATTKGDELEGAEEGKHKKQGGGGGGGGNDGGGVVLRLTKTLLKEAERIAEDDIRINLRMARVGASVIPEFPSRPTNILHHCNTGALACVDWGTALGVIHYCHKSGRRVHVWVDETRPRLQGARLSAWELIQGGTPMHLIADSASGSLMRRGKVDVVVFGADRVAANGDTVNKIGSYNLSVLAQENGVAVYAVVPTSTIDLSLATGEDIPIEERAGGEVTDLVFQGGNAAPAGVPVFNPAFDCTPHRYLTGIITEEGLCYPPFTKSLRVAKEKATARFKARWS